MITKEKLWRIATGILGFVFWTALTQVGGIAFLLGRLTHRWIGKQTHRPIWRFAMRSVVFCALYALISFVIVPPLAEKMGRVPMPKGDDNVHLQDLNSLTWICNRHYVVPELRAVMESVTKKMVASSEDTSLVLMYLDCNFPFFDGFPLPPHLSHDDGRKIDVAFFYIDAKTGKPTAERPSWLGYGVSEEPRAGEENRPEYCAEKGQWQYNFMSRYLVSQSRKKLLPFDATRTRDLLGYFLRDNRVQKLLIEPHLKTRLGFSSNNRVGFAGCNSVRHDDHVHVYIY